MSDNGRIVPPNTALIDSRGFITPPWYRFLTSTTRDIAAVSIDIDNSATYFLGDQAALPEAVSAGDMLALGIIPAFREDDFIPALPIEPDPVDLSSYAQTGKALALNIRTIATTTSPGTDDYTLLVDATAGTVTINLLAAASNPKRVLVIKKIDASANGVVIDPNGAELIDGAATMTLTTQYDSYTIQCDGAAWWVV